MNKTGNHIHIKILYLLFFVSLGMTLFNNFSNTGKRIVYVRSHDLVYGFKGTQEAISRFNEQKQLWQMNQDTLRITFEQEFSKFQEENSRYTQNELRKAYEHIDLLRSRYLKYKDAITEKEKEEDEKLMQGNLNQINSFVEEYAKEHGLDIIMGTTLDGSLLYADQKYDMTEEILEALNGWYEGS